MSGAGAQATYLQALLFCECGGGSLFYTFLYLGPDGVYDILAAVSQHSWSCIKYKYSTVREAAENNKQRIRLQEERKPLEDDLPA